MDKYTFFGCAITGHQYQYELDHYFDVCCRNSGCVQSSLFTRSQSEPDLRKAFFPGQDTVYPPRWLSLGFCKIKKSFSHYKFSDPNFEEKYPSVYRHIQEFDMCVLCHQDHPGQHSMVEWEDYWELNKNKNVPQVPDSITTDTIPETAQSCGEDYWEFNKNKKVPQVPDSITTDTIPETAQSFEVLPKQMHRPNFKK